MGNATNKDSVLQKPLLKNANDQGQPKLDRSQTLKSAANPLVQEITIRNSPLFVVFTAALRTASRLSNLLPTAVFLLFQIFTPLITNGGNCEDSNLRKIFAIVLLCCCYVICLVASLTDSFTDAAGVTHHGFITPWGLWTPHISGDPVLQGRYLLTWIDVIHSGLSVSVFIVLSSFDRNVRYCLYPNVVSDLVAGLMPIILGFTLSIVFMIFPTKRRGLGFLVIGETYVEVRVDGIHNFEAESLSESSSQPAQEVARVLEGVADSLDGVF